MQKLNKEYLEDYQQKERNEYERLVLRRVEKGEFRFGKDKYPSAERFSELQEPIAYAGLEASSWNNLWAQIPFCGSLVLLIPPLPERSFERYFFKKSKIPETIDFIKKTGKLQVVFCGHRMEEYIGLDYLDPFFMSLRPPLYGSLPFKAFGDENEIQRARDHFSSLAIWHLSRALGDYNYFTDLQLPERNLESVYIVLKLARYQVIDQIENAMLVDPLGAAQQLLVCLHFICGPICDLLSDQMNWTLEEVEAIKNLPNAFHPKEAQFPCEIGKFLVKKLTYAARDIRACYELMDHYDSYDLKKVQEALNEAIASNHPDMLKKSTKELSEILDNMWNDKMIPNRIKNIEIGVPVSIAAIGGIVAGLSGLFAGGFLSELGYKVIEKATEKYAEKLFGVKGEGLTERLAKLRTKSYQANIYDFKKKYNK